MTTPRRGASTSVRNEPETSSLTRLIPPLDDLTPGALAEQVARNAATAEQQDGRGPTGNSRLTATTGVILLVLVAIEGLTLVSLRPLLSAHVFVGMLLIPPIALKLGSAGYRFARYYTRDNAYVVAGPPQLLLRALGPFVILATIALFGSGVAMLAVGPDQGWIVNLHKASFIAWLIVTGVHVLGHILHLPGLAAADFRAPRERRSGSLLRQGAVAAALVSGLVLAIATLQYAAPWQAVIGRG
jgi:hypothetical protein